jgi:hypothetical protein
VNKKEAKKTLFVFGLGRFKHLAKRRRSFLVLFFKKELLAFLLDKRRGCRPAPA